MLDKITTKNNHIFFGYYNKSPWNPTQDKILFCESNFIDKQPTENDTLKIGYLNTNFNQKIYLTKTNAWNWQQGCMLQWHPTNKDIIIFNKKQKSQFVSIFFNIKTKKENVIPYPIYDIAKNGKYAISLNFSRLNNLRKGYGYEGLKDKFEKTKIPDRDGIFLINLKNKKKKLLISLKNLYSHKTLDSMDFGFHWVNHAEFSPNSKKIFFFHRWQVPNKMHYTRLFCFDLEKKELKLMPDSGLYSHMCWKNNNEIFGYAMKPGKIGNIRKSQSISKIVFNLLLPTYRKLIPKNIRKSVLPVGYFLFNVENNSVQTIPAHSEDGHPSFSPDRRFILTDTYPDKTHHRTLILYDTKLKQKHILSKFHSLPNKKYSEDPNWDSSGMRCDLHPRWNRDGKKVCIDSVHEGYRGIYIIDVSKITKN
jgi:hypothetical protein